MTSEHLPFHQRLRRERLTLGWTQEQLAEKIGIDVKTVNRWEKGETRPHPKYITVICQLFNKTAEDMGLFETLQSNNTPLAQTLPVTAIINCASASTDEKFARQDRDISNPDSHLFLIHEDWSEAPSGAPLYGRTRELTTLRQWLDDGCRIIVVLGMGGMGKTTLSTKFIEMNKGAFDYIFWRSLKHAPFLTEILTQCIQFLSDQQQPTIPQVIDEQITLLLHYLRKKRCLLVLDNSESILQAAQSAGQYREGYENYSRLLQRIGEISHRSCLILTSREKPEEVARLEGGKTAIVHTMYLQGVGQTEGQELLKDKELVGSSEAWAELIQRYSGNPLALKLISEPLRAIFGGDIDRFLRESETTFRTINDLLDTHFFRLSMQEQELLYWLVIEQEAVSLEAIRANFTQAASSKVFLDTLNSLLRRSLVETRSAALITLQPVIMEYLTNNLIDLFVVSFEEEEIQRAWANYALLKAQAKEYIRSIQTTLILLPVMQKLLFLYGKEGIKQKIQDLLGVHRSKYSHHNNYFAGNALNLLLHLKCDLRGMDFSRLVIRQAYLQNALLPEVNFSFAHFLASTFTSTSGNVLSVAFSPEVDILAAGTATDEIWVYETAEGRLLHTCYGHSDGVWSVAFSPDRTSLASASDDHTIRLWEVSSSNCLNILEGHKNRVRSIAFSPDGKRLASGSEDLTIRIWDTTTGDCLTILREHMDRIWSVSFSPDGISLASASTDTSIRIWDTQTGTCLRVLQGHNGWVLTVAFSPAGRILASGGDDKIVRLWDSQTGENIAVLYGHKSRIRSVAFSPDGRILASASEDTLVRLWDISAGQCLKILQGHHYGVRSVAFNASGQLLASGGDDQALHIWDVPTGRCLKTLQGYTNRIWSVTFNPDRKTLVSCGEDHIIRFWDIESGVCTKIFQDQRHGARTFALNSNGRLLVSGGEDRTIQVWDTATGRCLNTLHGHTNWIRTIVFSPDGHTIASGSEDCKLRLWNIRTGRCLRILEGHSSWIRAVTFNADGTVLASSSDDQTISLWETATGTLLATLREHTSQVRSVAFSPDGQMLASGGEDQSIIFWDVRTGHRIRTISGHESWVHHVSISPDGLTLASSSDDCTIRLWDVQSGDCLHILEGHTSRVRWVDFNSDGHLLASSSDDGSIKLWDRQQAICIQTFMSERPYESMNITGVGGLTDAQKATLLLLGAKSE